jgi:large subunit ribosomal protein L17
MEQKFGTKIKNAAETKNPITAEIETGRYMDLSFSRAPKRNHDALAQIGKQYVQWLKKHEVRTEIYHLSSTTNEVPPEGVESIAKTLSIAEDEEVWVALQFYRDRAHTEEVRSKMMQDESVGKLMKEFDGLVTQGKSLITDGFSRLKA